MKLKLMFSIVAVLLLSLFAVSAVGDGNMDVDTIQPESEMPGNQVTFTVTVYNNDVDETLNVDVTFDATGLSDEEEHTISAPEDVELLNIPKNSSRNQTFDIVVPGSLPEGDYTGYLTVTDKGNSNNTLTEQPFTLTILAKNDFSLSIDHKNLVVSASTSEDFEVTITNTGSTVLTNFSVVYHGDGSELLDNQHEDDDDEMLEYTYDIFPDTLTLGPGKCHDLEVYVEADNHLNVDHYLGDITFTAIGVNADGVDKKILMDVETTPRICEDGEIGKLDIDIKEPDNGDEYKPGEKIDIEVRVDNDDDDDNLDVVVEAILYNIDEDKEIETETSEEVKIHDNDDEKFKLTLTIPTGDFDEDDTYYLYVRAYEEDNEDDHCNFAWIEIDIERDRDDVIVDEFTMTPEVASPGDTVFFSVSVENIGTDEQEDVYIEINNKALKLIETSNFFDLEEYDDSDNDYVYEFDYEVPKDAKAGDYTFEAVVWFDDEDEKDGKMLTLTIETGEEEEASESVETGLNIKVASESLNLQKGQTEFTISLLLENNGDDAIEFTVDATDYSDWAEVISLETPNKLNPGDKFHSYLYLKLKDNIAPDVHNLRVNARPLDGALESKLLEVNVPGEASEVVEEEVEDSRIKDFFKDNSKLFWIIGDLVLIVLAVFFIRMLFKK